MIEFLLIGLAAGFAAGFLGIGGGLIIVPGLIWLFSRDSATASQASHLAVATSMATMLATSLSSIVAHHRRGAVRWDLFRQLAPGLGLGAALGAALADQLSSPQLTRVFALFALLAGLQLVLGRSSERQRPWPGPARTGMVGGVIGAISSLVGIGGGSMTGPWCMWHGLRAQHAVATAAACGYPIALVATASYLWLGPGAAMDGGAVLGYVHLPALAGIAVAGVAAAPLGAWAVHKTPPQRVRQVFGGLLLLVGARLLLAGA